MTTAILFVTNDAAIVPPGLAKVAKVTNSADEALSLCAAFRYGAVFCDAAPLANGGSGFRLGRQMRRHGISTPLFLMTSSIMSGMEGVATASGATASISRTATAILDALKSVGNAVTSSGLPGALERPLPEIDIVIERARIILKKYAGPVASMMIDDVLDDLYPKYPGGIAVDVFTQAVAAHVSGDKARADFLAELLD
ncbi:hypothetical protein [Zoogloea sp.]|uniref:hypothetical protein n=1 Tax=Zoogloea sp. TaxID=49181 RepID=UPI00261D2A2C|nr:hypothetical protein [uncultured Zoogloea sp.]MCK6386090.1 hypothetical protein [Zoogloea sp.]